VAVWWGYNGRVVGAQWAGGGAKAAEQGWTAGCPVLT